MASAIVKLDRLNRNGNHIPFLPEPYNWKTYGDMNMKFWEKHQSTPYEDAKKMLLQSHKEVLAIIEGFSNEELFEKQHFKWSGTTNIASYCISATSSHYDWAINKIKRQIKSCVPVRERRPIKVTMNSMCRI